MNSVFNRLPALLLAFLAAAPLAMSAAGCKREDMHNQARHEWQESSEFFADGMAARPQVEGTMATTSLLSNSPLLTTRNPNGGYADAYPFEVTRATLERGRQRFDIYCSMCHGQTGYGDGMIVRRGFVRPPSFHIDRLRSAPPGYFVEVITHGFGAMYSYNDRVTPEDRWKIAAYIKTLQLSQGVEMASLTPEERQQVEAAAAKGQGRRTEPPMGSEPVPEKQGKGARP
jgi:mono/diheme cytochrome c family protein